MQIAVIVVMMLTAGAALTGSWANFTRHRIPVAAAEQIRVPASLMRVIATLFLAAALGLLAGLVLPLLAVAAATGLVLFFCCAIYAHLRVHDHHLGPAFVALGLSLATLAAAMIRLR